MYNEGVICHKKISNYIPVLSFKKKEAHIDNNTTNVKTYVILYDDVYVTDSMMCMHTTHWSPAVMQDIYEAVY